MNNSIFLALLAAGVMVTIFGVSEMNSFTSDLASMLTGEAPTDRSIWMIVGGVVLVMLGLAGLVSGSGKN